MFRQNARYREMVKSRGARTVARCIFQSLESRVMLTTVNWDGGPTGNGTDFLTPANWAGDALPLAADTAVIGATGTSPTITISGSPAVQTINASRNLQMTGGALTGGALTLSGGAAMLASTSGGSINSVAVTGDLLINQTSAGILVSGTTTFTAARLQANNAVLYMAPGYTLNSLVVSEGAAGGTRRIDLCLGGVGTVTFGPSAVVRLATGSGGGLSIQNNSVATLINNGLITAEASGQQILIQPTGFTNNGTLQTLTSGTISVAPTNWTNAGIVTGTTGTFNIGGTFNATGGIGTFTTSALTTVNVTGTITNTGNTINLNGTTGSWTLLGGTINNGAIIETAGSTLNATTSGGSLNNVAVTGDLLINQTSAGILVSGTTTFTAARLQANNAVLYMAPGYTLNSLVVSEGAAGGTRRIDLCLGGVGTVTFGPSAVVRLATGSGGGLSIQNNSVATLINNGLITAEASGQQILIQPTGFTNNGTLQTLTSGTISVAPTNWTNAGIVTGTTGTFNIGGTFNATGGIGTFTTSALTTVNVTGTITNTGNTINLNGTTGSWTLLGGTINNGAIIETAGSTLNATTSGGSLNNVAVTGDLLINQTSAGILVSGTTTFTAARLQANNAVLYMAPGYTLNSLVVSEGAAGGTRRIDLCLGGVGTVTFGPSAVVRLATGSGGGLSIQNNSVATLINNGLITAEASGQQILIQPTGFTNNGTLQTLTSGTISVAPTNWTNAGIVTGTTGTFNIGGTFNATGGIGTFTTSALTTVNVTGTITNTGNTINLNGTTGSWTLLGGTINNGAIIETAGSTLNATTSGGSLNNVAVTGDLLINQTSAGILVSGTTTFTAARLQANNAVLYMAPGYTLNSLVVSEGAAGGTRRIDLCLGGVGTVTFGPSAVVRLATGSGGGLSIQNNSVATLINNGLITAEASGQQILIQPTGFTNNGTIRATGSSTMNVATPITGNLNGVSADGNGSRVRINAGTYSINQSPAVTNGGLVNFQGTPTKASTWDCNGKIIFNYTGASPLSTFQSDLASGYAAGAWTGAGIFSSSAALPANANKRAVGLAEATDLFTTFPNTFAGESVDNTTILLRYTAYGDATLDGLVNGADFNVLATNFGASSKRWVQGDFNFNATVNGADFNLLSTNFGVSVASFGDGSGSSGGLFNNGRGIGNGGGQGAGHSSGTGDDDDLRGLLS